MIPSAAMRALAAYIEPYFTSIFCMARYELSRRFIGNQYGSFLINPACGNSCITGKQASKHGAFIGTCYQPDNRTSLVKYRISQGHAPIAIKVRANFN